MSENFDGNILYGRRYRILVSGGGGGLDVSDLRCTFKIEKNMMETPDFSEVTIYNLSAQTENTIISQGQRVIVEAGYEGDQYGMIFDGDIIQPLRSKEEGVTYSLTLVAQDGDLFLNSGLVNASYKAGQTPRSIAYEVTSKAAEPIEIASISENLENTVLPRGKAVFGLARDYLHQIARTEEAVFYVADRKVNIVKAKDMPTSRAIDLTPATGLVGIPEQTEQGIQGKCLLNPMIKLNTFVHIDSALVRRQKASRDSALKQLDYSEPDRKTVTLAFNYFAVW